MITLYKDKFEVEISIKDVMPIDTKANMLECFQILGIKVSKSYRKDELATIYDNFFRQQTGYILDCLPQGEYQMLTRLLDMPKEHYLECPSNPDKFFFLQKCYMVFTYEKKDTWHIYMGDYVRNILKDNLARSMKSYPAIQEMHEILEEFTGLNKDMMALLEQHDPNHLLASDKKKLKKAFSELKSKMESCRDRLRKLEPELKKYNTPLECVYDSMEETLIVLTMAMFGVVSEEIAKDCTVKSKQMIPKQVKEESGTLIPLNPDYEQDIFTRRTIDTDCSLISILMDAEKENIKDLLEAQEYKEAALNYMQLLKSMCLHFVSDEHYNYFDDMYCPDYAATEMTDMFKDYQSEGKLPASVVDYLNKAWDEIRKEESFWNYGIPSEEW